jgi:hypothetical protein
MRESGSKAVKHACVVVYLLMTPAIGQSVPISLTIEAEEFSAAQGAAYIQPQDYLYVDSLGNGDWLRFDSINFMDGGFDSVYVWYWKYYGFSLHTMQAVVRIDAPQGTVIGTIALKDMSGWLSVSAGAALSVRPTGIHSVYLSFTGDTYVCDADKLVFKGKATASPADAKIYYVSISGNDADSGTSPGRPFKSIGRAASIMKPGSRCLIRQGIYRETVKPLYTGLAGAPLTFEAYNGENVVISGADPVAGWTSGGIAGKPNIFRAQMNWSLGRYKDQLLVDGKMAWVARCPNVDDTYRPYAPGWVPWCGQSTPVQDWKKWQSSVEPIAVPMRVCMGWTHDESRPEFTSDVSNNDPAPYQLPSAFFGKPANFFAGGLVTIHSFYSQHAGLITGSQSTSAAKTTFSGLKVGARGPVVAGAGWVSYVPGLLDAPNEWHRDSASSTVYLWAPDGGDPSRHLVEAKRRTLGFDLRGKQYVNLKGLHFLATSATLANASNCIIDGCYFKYVSHNDVPEEYEFGAGYNTRQDANPGHLGICVTGDHNTIKNTSVIGSAASGIIVGGQYNTITNCRIRACDYSVTYHAGILVRKCTNRDDPRDALGIKITHNSISFNSRANIQISGSARPANADERLLIEHNDLGAAVYTTQESASISGQNASLVDVSHNWFHDVNWVSVGSICAENDIGGYEWIMHHNIMWAGKGPVEGFRRGFDWTPEARNMVFNNTVVDSTDRGHFDWQYMRSFNSDGTLSNTSWLMDRGNMLWPRDTAYWKFTDAVNRDYTLRAGSPAIDAGVVVTGMPAGWPDANADVVDGKPDLGAYEYGRPRWVPGADWQEQAWVYPPPAGASSRAPVNLSPLATFRPSLRVGPTGMVVAGLVGKDCRITVFDAKGSAVSVTNAKRAETVAVSTHGLSAGIYFVCAAAGADNALWKVWVGAR